jgi:septal ring-binding cell division protein DamX
MTLETPPTEPTQPTEPAPAPRACPRCGAGLTPDQEWCLNCGADVGARVAETPRWRVPVIIVGTLLVLAIGAVALALIELADDDQQVAQAPPAQSAAPTPTPPAPPTGEQPAPGEAGATPGATVPEASDDATAGGQSGTTTPTPENEGDSATGQASPTATPSPGSTSTPGGNTDSGTGSTGTIASWPSGKTAWTVILESATSKSAADAKANELSSDGTSVGVLHSDDFSSLNQGYWVVFSGTYDSKSAAESALDGLKAKVPEAYARHVVPN